jgi:pyrroloquinoline quinone biosynthesis protein B
MDPIAIVLGTAQDDGIPPTGRPDHPGHTDPGWRRRAACLGLVDPLSGGRWMIDATPDFREQLEELLSVGPPPPDPRRPLDGILLTHAHVGHYLGLAFLGPECLAAREIPVYVMARMREFLSANEPWATLVRAGHVELVSLEANEPVLLGDRVTATPLVVPHRDELSETVAFRLEGPSRQVLWMPDLDGWEALESAGSSLETLLSDVDVAYVDGTFFDHGELPDRDMGEVPHPRVRDTLARLAPLDAEVRGRVRFVHLNHTNPLADPGSPARRELLDTGTRIADEGDRTGL